MNTRRWIAVVAVGGLGIVVGAVIYSRRTESRRTESRGTESPPGQWMEFVTASDRQAYSQKESEWSKQGFVPIEENQAFKDAVNDLPVRVETSLDPSQLQGLRELLYEHLICRSTGDMERYLEQCAGGRPAGIVDPLRRNWIRRIYKHIFNATFPEDAPLDDVFARFWQNEYAGKNSGKRFKDVAKDALIVIGDTHDVPPPESLFRPEELTKWTDWSGALRHSSIEMHPGKRSLAELSKQIDSFKFAEVALVIRSQNDDIWCWFTIWYLDPLENRWELLASMAVCSRRHYEVPL